MAYAHLLLGLVLLFVGGELLIRGAVALARRLRVSPLLIGATVVAFGTSAPELAVCVEAAWKGHASLAVGTVVGSNMANVLLILGLAGLVQPVTWHPLAVRRDAGMLMVASLVFAGCAAWGGRIASPEGAGMLLLLVALTAISYRRERQTHSFTVERLHREAEALRPRLPRVSGAALMAAAGLLFVVFGADQLIEGASALARAAGISEAVIGLTLVAVGTSLPELVTALVAAYHRHADVALGNVVGSNVFNQLGIAGSAGLVAPLAVPAEILHLDLWIMVTLMLVLSLVLLVVSRIGRRAALALLASYACWVLWRIG